MLIGTTPLCLCITIHYGQTAVGITEALDLTKDRTRYISSHRYIHHPSFHQIDTQLLHPQRGPFSANRSSNSSTCNDQSGKGIRETPTEQNPH